MYPVIEDKVGESGDWRPWRQVQLRVADAYPWEHNGVTWRVVAWGNPDLDLKAWRLDVSGSGSGGFLKLEPLGLDLGPHLAFCRGGMPAAVYADWLEENQIPIAPEGLALLRGWILGGADREHHVPGV